MYSVTSDQPAFYLHHPSHSGISFFLVREDAGRKYCWQWTLFACIIKAAQRYWNVHIYIRNTSRNVLKINPQSQRVIDSMTHTAALSHTSRQLLTDAAARLSSQDSTAVELRNKIHWWILCSQSLRNRKLQNCDNSRADAIILSFRKNLSRIANACPYQSRLLICLAELSRRSFRKFLPQHYYKFNNYSRRIM